MSMIIHLIWDGRREWRGGGLTEGPEGDTWWEVFVHPCDCLDEKVCHIFKSSVLKMHLCEPWVSRLSPRNTRMQQALMCSYSCRPYWACLTLSWCWFREELWSRVSITNPDRAYTYQIQPLNTLHSPWLFCLWFYICINAVTFKLKCFIYVCKNEKTQWTLKFYQIAALFIIARTWKQPRCTSADKRIRKLLYIYTMESYSAIKKNTFESVLMRWIKLEPIIQSEVSQKDKHQYIRNLERW